MWSVCDENSAGPDWFLQDMLIRRMLPTQQSVADRQLVTRIQL